MIWGSISDLEITNRYVIGLKTLTNILSRTSPSHLKGITVIIEEDEKLDSEKDLLVFEKLTKLNKINIEALASININQLTPHVTHIRQLRLSYCVGDDSFRSISYFLTNLRTLDIERGKTMRKSYTIYIYIY
jgi:hypothetical protein